jgi:hypothetical protein
LKLFFPSFSEIGHAIREKPSDGTEEVTMEIGCNALLLRLCGFVLNRPGKASGVAYNSRNTTTLSLGLR